MVKWWAEKEAPWWKWKRRVKSDRRVRDVVSEAEGEELKGLRAGLQRAEPQHPYPFPPHP